MFFRRLTVVMMMLSLVVAIPGATYAQAGQPADPNQVLLSVAELPEGFTRDPAGDTFDGGAGWTLMLRQFKDEDSIIQLVAITTTSSQHAEDQANGLLMSIGSQNVNFPMDEANVVTDIGEGAVVGWSNPDANGLVMSAVVFKSGNIAGAVIWTHPDDDEDNARIIEIARKMGARAATAV